MANLPRKTNAPTSERINQWRDRDNAIQLARVATEFLHRNRGHTHGVVNLILGDDTLVIRLDETLTAAKLALSQAPNFRAALFGKT